MLFQSTILSKLTEKYVENYSRPKKGQEMFGYYCLLHTLYHIIDFSLKSSSNDIDRSMLIRFIRVKKKNSFSGIISTTIMIHQ